MMKRQAGILLGIYVVFIISGYFWCLLKMDSINLIEVFVKTVLWSILGYGLWLILVILDRTKVLGKLINKLDVFTPYILYGYLICFLVEAFIGLLMVVFFKRFDYAYTYFAVLCVLHANKLSKKIIDCYHYS